MVGRGGMEVLVNRNILCMALAALVGQAGLVAPAMAWEALGTRDVRDAVDHDSIPVPGKRRFTRIRICAYQRPVHFIDVRVRFHNGEVQNVPVRSVVRAGKCTKAIDLEGVDRNISEVEFVYEANTPRRGVHATVRLFGE